MRQNSWEGRDERKWLLHYSYSSSAMRKYVSIHLLRLNCVNKKKKRQALLLLRRHACKINKRVKTTQKKKRQALSMKCSFGRIIKTMCAVIMAFEPTRKKIMRIGKCMKESKPSHVHVFNFPCPLTTTFRSVVNVLCMYGRCNIYTFFLLWREKASVRCPNGTKLAIILLWRPLNLWTCFANGVY